MCSSLLCFLNPFPVSSYYDGLLACLGLHRPSTGSDVASLSGRQLAELNSLFARLQAKHPKSAAAKVSSSMGDGVNVWMLGCMGNGMFGC